jgi:hypothetical protein
MAEVAKPTPVPGPAAGDTALEVKSGLERDASGGNFRGDFLDGIAKKTVAAAIAKSINPPTSFSLKLTP